MYVHKTKKGQPAFVQCVVKIPKDDTTLNYEMGMIHRRITTDQRRGKYRVEWKRLGEIWQNVTGSGLHTDNNNVKLYRESTPDGLQYKISYCVSEFKKRNIGNYHCRFEGANSVLNVRSVLDMSKSKTRTKPVVEFIPCESGVMRGRKRGKIEVLLASGNETCLRCRATGGATVAIRTAIGFPIRPGEDLDTYPNVTKVMYTDISDIRDSAVTYILHYPSKQHAGVYLCYANTSHQKETFLKFDINILAEKKNSESKPFT